MGNVLENVSGIILLIVCANFNLTIYFILFFILIYFTHMVRLNIILVCTIVQIQCSYERTI